MSTHLTCHMSVHLTCLHTLWLAFRYAKLSKARLTVLLDGLQLNYNDEDHCVSVQLYTVQFSWLPGSKTICYSPSLKAASQ